MKVIRKPLLDPAALYRKPVSGLHDALDLCIQRGVDRLDPGRTAGVFFRADDVGIPEPLVIRLMELFLFHDIPLALAVIPTWMTVDRWNAFRPLDREAKHLWQWHVHGWRHFNHEPVGKKQEFGPSRSSEQLLQDLRLGLNRLEKILENRLTRVFTPPWNRCDIRTMEYLTSLEYLAVSRNKDSLPAPVTGLMDIPVNVDLHTRKEPDPADGWRFLFQELENGIASGRCGVMIHHSRMNSAAFDFLDHLLGRMKRENRIQPISLWEGRQ